MAGAYDNGAIPLAVLRSSSYLDAFRFRGNLLPIAFCNFRFNRNTGYVFAGEISPFPKGRHYKCVFIGNTPDVPAVRAGSPQL